MTVQRVGSQAERRAVFLVVRHPIAALDNLLARKELVTIRGPPAS